MRIPRYPVMAPGPQAMEKGQPWTVPGNQYRSSSALGITQLESIQKLFQITEKKSPLVLSPRSMPDEDSYTESSRESVIRQDPSSFRHSEPESSYECDASSSLTISLTVPKVAQASSGGFFDPDNWVFRIVWDHVQHMDIDQLSSFYFYREDRGKYGEHHTSTRGTAAFGDLDEETIRQAKGNDNHRYQEQGRRVRHRCLQGESDGCIGTPVVDMAQKELPKIKRMIQQKEASSRALVVPGSDADRRQQTIDSRGTATNSRKLGKDDQLTAVLMSQHVASVLIFRQQEEITRIREELVNARAETKATEEAATHCRCHLEDQLAKREEKSAADHNAEAVHWRQQFEQSEAERRSCEFEILRLRQQLRQNKSPGKTFAQPLLPLPMATARGMRYFDRAEERSLSRSPVQSVPEEHPLKRRHCHLEPPRVSIQLNGQHRLPPSPTPSHDDSASSSSYFRSTWADSSRG